MTTFTTTGFSNRPAANMFHAVGEMLARAAASVTEAHEQRKLRKTIAGMDEHRLRDIGMQDYLPFDYAAQSPRDKIMGKTFW